MPAYIFRVGLHSVTQVDASGRPKEGLVHILPKPIEGMGFNAISTKFQVILGMDVIMQGSLKLDYDGHFSFCF